MSPNLASTFSCQHCGMVNYDFDFVSNWTITSECIIVRSLTALFLRRRTSTCGTILSTSASMRYPLNHTRLELFWMTTLLAIPDQPYWTYGSRAVSTIEVAHESGPAGSCLGSTSTLASEPHQDDANAASASRGDQVTPREIIQGQIYYAVSSAERPHHELWLIT